ncbi:hypothetical protein DMP17_22165 [Pseudonocardia sp. TMWB2A]|uniref:head-tail connector protein n=1 Tax=Pseudonocardia sp. TMWB2A TaxID=687430 RepID=UPI00307F530E
MPGPLDVLPLEKAKQHLNRTVNRQPGEEDELIDMIGAAVDRVERHLGRFPVVGKVIEQLACKVVLAEYWETQRPDTGRTGYPGASGPDSDDGPTSQKSIRVKLTELLGPPAADTGGSPQGLFPPPRAWPDPVDQVARW